MSNARDRKARKFSRLAAGLMLFGAGASCRPMSPVELLAGIGTSAFAMLVLWWNGFSKEPTL